MHNSASSQLKELKGVRGGGGWGRGRDLEGGSAGSFEYGFLLPFVEDEQARTVCHVVENTGTEVSAVCFSVSVHMHVPTCVIGPTVPGFAQRDRL